jgi:hypothetical protein
LDRYEEITGQSTLEDDQSECCHVLDALSDQPSVHWPHARPPSLSPPSHRA